MSKYIDFNMGKFMYELASKPLRTKRDLILLVLNTIRIIGINVSTGDKKGKIILKVDHMNRLFYEIENKIFTIQFPFSIELKEENSFRVYDNYAGVDIDNKIISLLIGMFENYDLEDITFESFFMELYQSADASEDVAAETLWILIKRIALFDVGYLRYDHDKEHEKGKMHPLDHLDINYESNSTYKIGLRSRILLEDMIDIVDISSECYFLHL